MKRSLAFVLPLILCCFLFSCGSGGNAGNNASTPEAAVPPMAEMAAMRAMPTHMDTIPAPTGYIPHLFRTKEALDYIGRYAAATRQIGQFSFVMNTQDLLNYLNATHNSIVNFVIGQNATDDSLFLFLASVDDKGENQYYNRNDTCYLMAGNNLVDIPTTLEIQQTNVIDTYFLEAMTTTDAQSMIDFYQSNYSASQRNNGWLYNAHDLAGYLQAGLNAGGMQYTQFILAMDANRTIHLVIVGSDDGTNHMYMGYAGKSCVMENTSPCPVCNTMSGGSTFDPPKCTY